MKARILLVEDRSTDALLISSLLATESSDTDQFAVTVVANLYEALRTLEAEAFDLVILDLMLPDSEGLATFETLANHHPGTAVVVVTNRADVDLGSSAVARGAEDFVSKELLSAQSLRTSIRYAVQRHKRFVAEARVDRLTGIANRAQLSERLRAALARQRRAGTWVALAFFDLDGFKAINDRHGHAAGDAVLVETAKVLAASVRPSDTIARLGGDEFVVVMDDIADQRQARLAASRLSEVVTAGLAATEHGSELGVSVGVALSAPESPADAEALLAQADRAMYEAKRSTSPD